MGLVTGKPTFPLGNWTFQPYPHSGELLTNGQWLNQLCLCNKAPKGWGSENFQVGEHMVEVLRE